MRNKLTILMAGLTLAASAWAQSAQVPAEGHKHARGRAQAFERLNLTQDQKSKLQSLRQTERTQIDAIRNNSSLTDEQKKQQIADLRKNDRQQFLAVLTPEQQAQMKEMRQDRGGRRGAFDAGRRFQALNLTEQQKSQLKPIFQSTRQQMQALRSDTSLTPEQKHEKMQQIRQNQMTQMKSILTPEQQQQLEQHRGRRMHKGNEQQQAPPSA
jgi:Spy/CpxP family protein refolding chaperone